MLYHDSGVSFISFILSSHHLIFTELKGRWSVIKLYTAKMFFTHCCFPIKIHWWQFIFSWQEDHLVMKPRRRSIHRLLERLSLYWNHTQVTKRKRISPKTWWHKAQRAPIQTADLCAKNPYQRPAVRCCLARIIFILHLRCPRFHREKIAYTLVLHLTKKSQLIKAITSMYIMNNQEENIIFPLQS